MPSEEEKKETSEKECVPRVCSSNGEKESFFLILTVAYLSLGFL